MTFRVRLAMVFATVFAAVFAVAVQAADEPGFKCLDDFEDGCSTDGVPAKWAEHPTCVPGTHRVEDGKLIIGGGLNAWVGTWIEVALTGDVSVQLRASCNHNGRVTPFLNARPYCNPQLYYAYVEYGSGTIGIGGNNAEWRTAHLPRRPQIGEAVELKFEYTAGELQLRVWFPDSGEAMPDEPLLRHVDGSFRSGAAGVFTVVQAAGGEASYDFISIEATGEINEILDDFEDDDPLDGNPAVWKFEPPGTCGGGTWRCEDGKLILGDVAGDMVATAVEVYAPVASAVRLVAMTEAELGYVGAVMTDSWCGGKLNWGSVGYNTGNVNIGHKSNWTDTYTAQGLLNPPPLSGEWLALQHDFTGSELWLRVWRPDEGEDLPAEPLLRAPENTVTVGMGGTYFGLVTVSGEMEYESIYIMDAPRAALKVGPTGGTAPLEVTADGSLSRNGSASVRKIVRHQWDFGDGSPVVEGVTATHTYAEAGRYTVRLTVTDDYGVIGMATRPIGVSRPLGMCCPASGDVAPWTVANTGEPLCPGSAWQDGEGIALCAGGQATSASDEFLYVYRETDGTDNAVVVRVEEPTSWQGSARIGLMLRESLDPAADFTAITYQRYSYTDGPRLVLRSRKAGVVSVRAIGARTLPAWLKIAQQGEEIVMEDSPDGIAWTEAAREPLSFSSAPLAGLAACGADSGDPYTSFTAMRVRVTDLALSPGAATFVRGDANADGKFDIADAICVLGYLFGGAEDACKQKVPACFDAADANDDGKIDIADAVKILGYLFAQAGPLPAPFPACGIDPDPIADEPDALDCTAFAPCE